MAARRHGGKARAVLAGAGLSGLVVVEDSAFVTQAEDAGRGGSEVRLLRVDLRDGSSEEVAALTYGAAQMVWGDGWLCWREERGGALPGVEFVAAAAPVTVMQSRQEGREGIETLAVLPARQAGAARQVELIGVAGGHLYWLEGEAALEGRMTVVRRAALPKGEAEVLVREEGRRRAVLTADRLVWTAPSREAAETNLFAAVRVGGLDGSEARVVGDWLNVEGSLLTSEGKVYVQTREWLWLIGDERGEQRVLRKAPRGLVTATAVGDEEYAVVRMGGGLAVARQPLTWWARVRGVLPM